MNNYSSSTKEISIQISLDGYSFMMHDLQSGYVFHAFECMDHNFSLIQDYLMLDHSAGVRVVWNVDQAQVIPMEIFDESLCLKYMEMANLKSLVKAEVSLWEAHHQGQWVAIWQADAQVYQRLMETLENQQTTHTHPLLIQIEEEPSPETVTINLLGHTAHIKIYNRLGELTFAESMAVSNYNDLLLMVRQSAVEDTFKQYRILIAGDQAQELSEFMSQYYGRVNYL